MKTATTILAAAASLSVANGFAPTTPTAFSARPQSPASATELDAAVIQFVRDLDEKVIPNVKLTRARDGGSGVATFTFQNPNVFDASTAAQGEILGMFMIDDEGEISTTKVNASFANGKPMSIESTYVMTSPDEWDRFMRFMGTY